MWHRDLGGIYYMARNMKEMYNTHLAPADEAAYQQWVAKTGGRDEDYDLRGAFKAGITPDERGHFPDTYKKPNSPTFSDESIYHGVDNQIGGNWSQDKEGKWTFTAGEGNFIHQSPNELLEYWKLAEPNATLVIPPAALAKMTVPGDNLPQPQTPFPNANTPDLGKLYDAINPTGQPMNQSTMSQGFAPTPEQEPVPPQGSVPGQPDYSALLDALKQYGASQ
jgi:hypothetical protein